MPAKLYVWNGERAHVGRWRELEGIAVIAPIPGGASPSPSFIRHCCEMFAEQGFQKVVTPALAPAELVPFLQVGFSAREQLYVLTHDLTTLASTSARGVALRKFRSGDLPGILDVDRRSFDEFWRFDAESLTEACSATPQARFRVAVTDSRVTVGAGCDHVQAPVSAERVVGYCITGRSRQQGFLQRLAVAPEAQGLGIGSALVWDALNWLRRRRAHTCVVNTQETNGRAMTLYKSCGFQQSPSGLHVLTRPLESSSVA